MHCWLREQEQELRRRQQLFGDPPGERLRGRHLIVVDDGIATGMAAKAAMLFLRKLEPASLALAVPVVDRDVTADLSQLVDRLVALAVVSNFGTSRFWPC